MSGSLPLNPVCQRAQSLNPVTFRRPLGLFPVDEIHGFEVLWPVLFEEGGIIGV